MESSALTNRQSKLISKCYIPASSESVGRQEKTLEMEMVFQRYIFRLAQLLDTCYHPPQNFYIQLLRVLNF